MGKLYKKTIEVINNIMDYVSYGLFGVEMPEWCKHIVLLFFINLFFIGVYSIFTPLAISLPLATGTSILIGYAKEYFDKLYTTGFSKKDMFMNMVGIFISDLLVIIIWG